MKKIVEDYGIGIVYVIGGGGLMAALGLVLSMLGSF